MSYELIETVEVGAGGAASIEFTSIPQDGTDLVLLVSARGNSIVSLSLNGSTSNFSSKRLQGNGSAASSITGGDGFFVPFGNASSTTANTFASARLTISNYVSSLAKSISIDAVDENNAITALQGIIAMRWNNTAAVTSITLTASANSWVQYTTASLYKITAA